MSSFEIASWDDSHASSDVFRISSVCSANQSDCSRLVDWTTALLPVNSRREVLCQCTDAVTELTRQTSCVSLKSELHVRKSELHVRKAVGTSSNIPHRQSMSVSTSRARAKAHALRSSRQCWRQTLPLAEVLFQLVGRCPSFRPTRTRSTFCRNNSKSKWRHGNFLSTSHACLAERLGRHKVDIIKPQVGRFVFPVRHGVNVFALPKQDHLFASPRAVVWSPLVWQAR